MLLGVVLVVTALVSLGLGFDTVPDALAYPAMVVGIGAVRGGRLRVREVVAAAVPARALLASRARRRHRPGGRGHVLDDALVVASAIAVIVGVGVVVRELVFAASQRRGALAG